MTQITNNQMLRFTTAGSVDDGKSTLIGRLLYDSKSIFADQMEAIERSSELKGFEHVDLSLITDGLKAEREQGITIDVAYRYFATPKRKFIIADTPGHIQYTRNMVTGASTANLALILIDARKGIVEQTCRHSYIASLLMISTIIVCVNKMDLVEYDEHVYNRIIDEYKAFSDKLEVHKILFVPISALEGDNIVHRSAHMNWYHGPTLMHLLETIQVDVNYNHIDSRFPIQYVMQNHFGHVGQFYSGRIAGGVFKVGDEVIVSPSKFKSRIKSISLGRQALQEAFAPMSVTITLEDHIDIVRGDVIAKPNNYPVPEQNIELMICWMNQRPFPIKAQLLVRHTTAEVIATLITIHYKLDINSLRRIENVSELTMNDIAYIKIRTAKPLMVDSYRKNRTTGSIILVDETTNETVGAGMIV
jgi:sulfate adenylyltransferase subunit 1